METLVKSQVQIEKERVILKMLHREILKCAKKDEYHYYWDITSLDIKTINNITYIIEKEGKIVNNKGTNFKIIRW